MPSFTRCNAPYDAANMKKLGNHIREIRKANKYDRLDD